MPQRSSKSAKNAAYANSGESAQDHAGRREYSGVALIAASIFLLMCLTTFDPMDPSFNGAVSARQVNNLCGLFGSHISDAFVQVLGLCSFMIPPALLVFGVNLFFARRKPMVWSRVGCFLTLTALCAALAERLERPEILNFPPDQPGGAIGDLLHGSLLSLMGSVGELLFIVTLACICGAHVLNISLRLTFNSALGGVSRVLDGLKRAQERRRSRQASKRLQPPPAPERDPKGEPPSKPVIFDRHEPHKTRAIEPVQPKTPIDVDYDWRGDLEAPSWERLSWLPDDVEIDTLPPDAGVKARPENPVKKVGSSAPKGPSAPEGPTRIRAQVGHKPWGSSPGGTEVTYEQMKRAIEEYLAEMTQPMQQAEESGPEPDESRSEAPDPAPRPAPRPTESTNGAPFVRGNKPAANESVAQNAVANHSPEAPPSHRAIEVADRADNSKPSPILGNSWETGSGDYLLPPPELLDDPDLENRSVDKHELEINALVLEQKLEDLGIKGEITAIHPGPVITMYELSLAAKIPLRKVLNKADDLAMALKSGSTRVVAPIPGKDTVGIEVPNLNRETVYFKEIVQSQAFSKSKEPLKIALGKGIDGEPFSTSLARMPHLLIAGATGTGKSVGLNSMILSWLMSCHPDDVKFLMVDPKKLELSYYQDIPHLIHPVVTEPEKVPKVLGWAIREMERRYELLSKAGAKNIEGYNDLVLRARAGASDEEGPEKLPYIVIIVDELAELMMVAAKDIEVSIARLAQMARAAGIHLILATQRPSVDVITGVIKANFPARLSFQVSAKADSRTILDTVGAEALLGKGDLLFLPPGTAKLRRLHGAFVSENEIRNIVDHIKAQRGPVYLEEISKHVSEAGGSDSTPDTCDDEKYDDAVELVTRLGHASISLIQRHMRIGYNRAARIIEAMESEGIIGPSDGTSRPREVLAGSLDHIPDRPS